MHKEFFEIIHRFHTYRNSAPIRQVTLVQIKQLQRECPSWMLRFVNKFLEENFADPSTKTG